jgi:sterol desaturase/sphingolipid hydroxylase (fatty acid hydroxylase superfamily)
MHRWQHSNKWLWRIHEAHHSPKKVDWLSGSRSHALEILINQTVEFAPIVLLGAPVEVISYKGVISAVWGMYIHSNIDVRTGWLQKIINGPEMHRWHHSTGKGRNRNFATKLAIWDWIFGTAYLPPSKPDEYGLKTYFPKNYFTQTLYAFRKFSKRQNNL